MATAMDRVRPEGRQAPPSPSSVHVLWLAIGIGLLAVFAFTLRAGIGSAALLGSLGCGLVLVLRGRRDLAALVAAATALVPFLVIRDNSWLGLCIVFTAGLVGSFAATAAGTSQALFDFRPSRLLRIQPATESPTANPDGAGTIDGALVFHLIRGAALTWFVVWVFSSLLGSADAVFGEALDLFDLPLSRFGIGAVVGAVFFRTAILAAARRTAGDVDGRRPLGIIEATMCLGALNVLFFVFVVIRLGNVGKILSEEAWRTEVRSGFFQLLLVAVLTVALLLALHRLVKVESSAERTRFRALALTTVALAAVIDVIALQRIADYVERSFLTPLRWWSFGFGCFIMVVLALVALRITDRGPGSGERSWMSAAVVITWMVFVLAMGLLNPDRRMAEYNFDNPEGAEGLISVLPLMWMSEDATPVIVDNIDVLRPMPNTRYERMVEHLCSTEPQSAFRQWNISRADAARATVGLCP